ncbi:MAG: tRNA (cmo5U34)-methyltransferase, partial [Helicobacter sp.]|nr:tRNA (cmo5U34)-methyltransferase [Helicobacter sp.]
QGYSDFEIAKKREALENVLVPYSEAENRAMLLNAGFSCVETLFAWVNFRSFVAVRK